MIRAGGGAAAQMVPGGSGGIVDPRGRERRPGDALGSRAMVTDGLRLVCRREVDLLRVISAACS